MFDTSSNYTPLLDISAEEIKALNQKYKPLSAQERIKQLYIDFDIADIMLTSSFAATSAFLLKLISDINNKQEVFFIDTGYHFEDTLKYKATL
jgi:phosphoadenosine phosphosulfate reductase